MPLADALARYLIAFDVTAIFLGEGKAERTRVDVHVMLVVRNVGDGQGAHECVEMLRIVATSRLEDLWTCQSACFEIIEIAEVVFAIIARRRFGHAGSIGGVLGQTKAVGVGGQAIIGLACGSWQELMSLIVEIDDPGMRLAELLTRLATEAILCACCRIQIPLVSGIQEDFGFESSFFVLPAVHEGDAAQFVV